MIRDVAVSPDEPQLNALFYWLDSKKSMLSC